MSNTRSWEVPVAPFRKYIERAVQELGGIRAVGMLIWPESDPANAHKVVSLLLDGSQEKISFPKIDLIMTKLGHVLEWINDPELEQIYREVDLFALDAAIPLNDECAKQTYGFIVELTKELGGFGKVAKQLGINPRSVRKAHDFMGADSPSALSRRPVAA